jgi:CheY-like chemotaxis protein
VPNKHNKQRFVLCVDDEDAVQVAFEHAFKGQTEFILDQARTVREALEKIETAQYDIIALDMKLDGQSWAGMSILREINRLEIRARSRGLPLLEAHIIIMSGSVPFSDFMQEANELGVLTFLDKRVQFTPGFVRRSLNRVGIPLLPPQRDQPQWPDLPSGNPASDHL